MRSCAVPTRRHRALAGISGVPTITLQDGHRRNLFKMDLFRLTCPPDSAAFPSQLSITRLGSGRFPASAAINHIPWQRSITHLDSNQSHTLQRSITHLGSAAHRVWGGMIARARSSLRCMMEPVLGTVPPVAPPVTDSGPLTETDIIA